MEGIHLQVSNWPWYYVATYFFIGGIAAGSYLLASVADLWGDPAQDKPMIKTGYLLALIMLIICPILLILDLGKPDRFWRMLTQFKLMSPVSLGTWGLTLFGIFSALSAGYWLGILRGLPHKTIAVIGSILALFVAGYTGVLLSSTTNPFWNSNPFLGITFLVSAVSTAIAAVSLLMIMQGLGNMISIYNLRNLWLTVLGFEVFLLTWELLHEEGAILFSGQYFMTFVIAVILVGVLIPLILLALNTGKSMNNGLLALVALMVLVGGFCFRYSILVAGQEYVGVGEHARLLLAWFM